MIRVLAALSGVAVICAATNANVMSGGGWTSTDAPLIVSIAVLLAVGTAFAAIVWRDGARLGAAALVICLLAGEAYWLGITAERELASRETAAAPHIAASRARSEAEARAANALAVVAALPATSVRLDAAIAAKSVADAAAVARSAERGCAANCRGHYPIRGQHRHGARSEAPAASRPPCPSPRGVTVA